MQKSGRNKCIGKPKQLKAMPVHYGTPVSLGEKPAHGRHQFLIQKPHGNTVANSNYFGNMQKRIKSFKNTMATVICWHSQTQGVA